MWSEVYLWHCFQKVAFWLSTWQQTGIKGFFFFFLLFDPIKKNLFWSSYNVVFMWMQNCKKIVFTKLFPLWVMLTLIPRNHNSEAFTSSSPCGWFCFDHVAIKLLLCNKITNWDKKQNKTTKKLQMFWEISAERCSFVLCLFQASLLPTFFLLGGAWHGSFNIFVKAPVCQLDKNDLTEKE